MLVALLFATLLLAYTLVSRRLEGSPVSPALVFAAGGIVTGVLNGAELTPADLAATRGDVVRVLAELALALVLFADASSIGTSRTAVIASSRASGGRTSSHRPGTRCSEIARSAAVLAAESATGVARPNSTTDRKFMLWWNADRASTSPSRSVTLRQTGQPASIPRKSRLAADP